MFSQPITSLPIVREELGVARRDVDDLGGIEADSFRDDRAPSFAESVRDHTQVCSGRA